MQVAGEGGIGEDEVVEVGVLLEFWKISSSKCEGPGGEVASKGWAVGSREPEGFSINRELFSSVVVIFWRNSRFDQDQFNTVAHSFIPQECFLMLF